MKKLLLLILLCLFLCGCGDITPKSAYDKLDNNEKIAYKILDKGSVRFKNPASIRLVEAKLRSSDSTLVARISAENGFGGHGTTIYSIKEDGNVIAWDKDTKKAGEMILGVNTSGEVILDVEKMNRAWIEKHP